MRAAAAALPVVPLVAAATLVDHRATWSAPHAEGRCTEERGPVKTLSDARRARRRLVAAFGHAMTTWRSLHDRPVPIAGVGFFDDVHGQNGLRPTASRPIP
jgi:hypothetical protein